MFAGMVGGLLRGRALLSSDGSRERWEAAVTGRFPSVGDRGGEKNGDVEDVLVPGGRPRNPRHVHVLGFLVIRCHGHRPLCVRDENKHFRDWFWVELINGTLTQREWGGNETVTET